MQVSSTAGFGTNPNTPSRGSLTSPVGLQSRFEGAGSPRQEDTGSKGLTLRANSDSSPESQAATQALKEKVSPSQPFIAHPARTTKGNRLPHSKKGIVIKLLYLKIESFSYRHHAI